MGTEDVPAAEQISDEAFFESDQRSVPRGAPPPQRRTAEHSAAWIARTRRIVDQDPGGCWVAEDSAGVVGFATSFVRGRVWLVSGYAVRPGRQGTGVGRLLLEAAEAYGARCPAAMVSASGDPRALRRYWRAGFALHPQMFLRGTVDRTELASNRDVREAGPEDVGLMDAIVADLRGGGHGPDHHALAEVARPVLAETATGQGFAYSDGARLAVLAATDEATARDLLPACMAGAGQEYLVPHVTAANQWAIDVALGAGLTLEQSGYLAVRGLEPPSPYIHNGALL